MRSAAAAFAWEFRRRHRWGLVVLISSMAALAMVRALFLRPGRLHFNDAESFALTVVVPLTATFLYFLAVFSYGLSGDIAARQSIYPARMFTLPLTTRELAAWPMLYGTIAMALLWFSMRLLAVWPEGAHVPVVWPALLAASLLAWTQALTWMPYALPGLRVVITVLWLSLIDAIVLVALEFKPGEGVMLALLAPHIPLAFLAAQFSIGRARRGDVPDWGGIFAGLERLAGARRQKLKPFRSAARAQVWFEWRQHGRSLPALVALLLPFWLSMFFVFRETPPIVFECFAGVLLTPVVMAAFVAATVAQPGTGVATRPLTDAALIAAKLKATIWSTAAAWLLVLVTLPIALKLSGTSVYVVERWGQVAETFGTPRATTLVLLGLAACIASTWKQLVSSLYIRMSGREWLVKASVFGTLSFLAIIIPLLHFAYKQKVVFAALWIAFPWIIGALVCVKTIAALWVAVRLHRSRIISDRALLLAAVLWDAAVFVVFGLLAWIFPNVIVRHYFLALIAILAVPVARLSAAPLALSRSRHR